MHFVLSDHALSYAIATYLLLSYAISCHAVCNLILSSTIHVNKCYLMAFHAMSRNVMLSQIVFFYLILFYAILRCLMLCYAAFWYLALSLNCRDASDAS